MTEIIIALLIAIGGAVFAYRKGGKDVQEQYQVDQFNEYIATKKRIQDAIDNSDSDDARDRMRNRDPNKR